SVIDLWAIDAMRGIAIDGDAISLGALTTYTDIRRSALCREHVPALVEAAATIGAAQIQNRGTIGGNIANASPAGDTLPVLLAADAVFVVGSERGRRDVRVALGSVAATPIRAPATEAALEAHAPTPETADLAAETLAGELSPIDDVRSTAEYRRLVAARVLHRIVRDAGGW